ncbi:MULTISPECIES: TerD family protein [unclassified Streptomyces]|uniref:TerD family protein n=1 Tax=unclassified Streptomyces TaxID=2593676 RepID=UPI0035E231B5
MGHITESSWVPSVTLRVGVGTADVAALLLDSDGRVRGDADMVFAGQPVHPSGAVRHDRGSLAVALHEVEAEVERIAIVGSAAGGSLAAMAPDRAVVVAYLVGVPEGAEAVVFGEFFRESGGWKFTGIGKGYASGLAALVTDYGVEVAEEEPAASAVGKPAQGLVKQPAVAPVAAGPVSLTSVAKLPAERDAAGDDGGHPASSSSASGVNASTKDGWAAADSGGKNGKGGWASSVAGRMHGWVSGGGARGLGEDGEFGPDFKPFTAKGEGDSVVTVDSRVPAGPVLIEVTHQGADTYIGVLSLDENNEDDGPSLFSSRLPDFTGSTVAEAPEGRPLRLRLAAYNAWTVRVRPVGTARRLRGTLKGYGPEALLYTGGPADLTVDFKGDKDGEGYVGLQCHKVVDGTVLSPRPTLLLNKTGRQRATVPLPGGPLLLLFMGDGRWSLTVRELDF